MILMVCCLFLYFFVIPTNVNITCKHLEDDTDEKKVASVIEEFHKGNLNKETGNEEKSRYESRDYNIDLFKGYDELPLSELENNYVPNEIYYVWCYNRTIEFKNYLSIMAAWKLMRPDSITFYTKHSITDNNEHYNFWLSELLTSVSGFKVEKLPRSWDRDEHGCGIWFALAVLEDVGGIYFSSNFFPLQSLRFIRKNKFTVATTKNANEISFISSIPKSERLKSFIKLYKNKEVSPPLIAGLHYCETLFNVSMTTIENNLCIHLENIIPVQIMHLNSTFGSLARKIMYGDSQEIKVQPILPGTIPKIVHMVWFGFKTMDFVMYLCLRSILTVVNPDKVYIHGDGQMHGKYLQKLKKDNRVIFVYREIPRHVFGKQIIYMQHRSDIIRADILLKYGGIYSDWDVIWLKPIDELISKGYDTILNFDHMPRPGYPDSINLGVLMSKPGAHFIKRWQDSLVNYRSRDFFFNAIELPYKTFERYPHTVHVESHLQVMCYFLKCHPTFHPDFRNYNVPQPFDWTKDVYSIHFTHPDPPAYANESALQNSTGMFADIGNFILKQHFEYD